MNIYDRPALQKTGEVVDRVFLRTEEGRPLDLPRAPAYSSNAVKQPLINVEENQKMPDKLSVQAGIQRGIDRAAEISRRMKSGEIRFPKGVFRFKTVEEADEWKNKILAGN